MYFELSDLDNIISDLEEKKYDLIDLRQRSGGDEKGKYRKLINSIEKSVKILDNALEEYEANNA